MKTYLVGGAVRDQLLEFPFHERDWVVVGATPEHMLEAGYQQVGKDFPVFLHPLTKEEYALARTERKQGTGYTGFAVHADPSVTLEEDLLRRDLTINAMALAEDGDSHFLSAICRAARNLQIITVAQRVENQQQVELLSALPVDAYQGYVAPPQRFTLND